MTLFGFRTGTFRGWPVEQAAARLAWLGYDCVELCLEAPDVRPEYLDEVRCREIRRTLDAIGIGLASVSYHGDGEPLEQRRANQQRTIQISRWMGAPVLVLNAERAVDRARQWAEHVQHWRALCRLAEESNVMLAIEPEPLLVVGSSMEMIEMIDAVGSRQLAVNLDIGHAYLTDDDVVASIHQLGSAIVHLHLEDIRAHVHRHLTFGQGDIDLARVRCALEEIGYGGPYVADLFGIADEASSIAARALGGLKRWFG